MTPAPPSPQSTSGGDGTYETSCRIGRVRSCMSFSSARGKARDVIAEECGPERQGTQGGNDHGRSAGLRCGPGQRQRRGAGAGAEIWDKGNGNKGRLGRSMVRRSM
eukprot:3873834-Prymnesium_polylepis.2